MTRFPSRRARFRRVGLATLLVVSLHPLPAGADWGERLAARFSPRWTAIARERGELEKSLSRLPEISTTDFGGTAGYSSLWIANSAPPEQDRKWVEIRWTEPALIDLVALVPARNFDEHGLDPQHGLPEDFRVVLLDGEGKPVATVGEVQNAWSDAVRRGHPFLFPVQPAVRCSGLRIESSRLHKTGDQSEARRSMAWSEAYCFAGERNVAAGARVTCKDALDSPWPWNPAFLVDRQTCLGLPEIPAPEIREIGWLSRARPRQDQEIWVQVDLGKPTAIDGLRLFPVLRPLSDRMPGFAFPRRFRVEVSATGEPGSYTTVVDQSDADFENPGHHAVTLVWPEIEGRFVLRRASVLWKISGTYPAFLSFSEMEVLRDDTNLARGCAVTSSDQIGEVRAHGDLFWSERALTNGYGPRGRLITTRAWLEQLHRRYEVESALDRMSVEAAGITSRFRRGTLSAAAVAGLVLVGTLFVLPVWYRSREARKVSQIRRRLAGDLHDDIGSNLGTIELLAEAAVRKPHTAPQCLRDIGIITTESVASLRDIVWLLRPDSASQIHTVEHLREKAGIMLEELEWHFDHDPASSECRLSLDAARQLLLCFQEMLHNIRRHAQARRVTIQVRLEAGIFCLTVADDGRGIAPDLLAAPRCLRALKERATRLAGTLEVKSAVTQGTTITLRFPLNHRATAKLA